MYPSKILFTCQQRVNVFLKVDQDTILRNNIVFHISLKAFWQEISWSQLRTRKALEWRLANQMRFVDKWLANKILSKVSALRSLFSAPILFGSDTFQFLSLSVLGFAPIQSAHSTFLSSFTISFIYFRVWQKRRQPWRETPPWPSLLRWAK